MPDSPDKLSAAQRSRIRRLSAPKELAPDEEGGELNIVPFLDIITNVLMFVLATISVTFTTMIDSEPPRAGGSAARPPTKPTLSLNIIVIDKGFIVSAFGQRIGEGCQGPGSGVAVGLTTSGGPQDYDYRQAQRVREAPEESSAKRRLTRRPPRSRRTRTSRSR